ncbi:hypothetical protein [Streptomyces sp. NPDC046385]
MGDVRARHADAPERLRSLMDAVFTRQTELTLSLEFDALVAAA